MSIRTGRGDQGVTDTLSQKRIAKNDPLIELIGSLDEFSSALGTAKVQMCKKYALEVEKLQHTLIQIMGYISSEFKLEVAIKDEVRHILTRIDALEALYPTQNKFVLPGGSESSSRLDVSRAIIRRAERTFEYIRKDYENIEPLGQYLNVLSDYIYCLARAIDFENLVQESLNQKRSGLSLNKDFDLKMSLKLALTIAGEVISEAEKMHCHIVVSICNQEGINILTLRMDEAFVVSIKLAEKKAFTSAIMKMKTDELGKLTAKGEDFEGLENMVEEELVTLGGGIPLNVDRSTVGGIGVSGGSVEQDIHLASVGAKFLQECS